MKISRTFIVALILLICSLGMSALLDNLTRTTPVLESSQPKQTSYKRVICFSPLCTEIAFQIGAAEKIVGVSKFSNYPPQAKQKPIVGDSYTINSEQVIALKPDLVIVDGKAQKVYDFCNANNIEILRLDTMNIEKLFNSIDILGKKLGHQAQSQKLRETISSELKAVKDKVKNLPKRSVFLCLYRQSGSLSNLSTIGPDTVTSELLSIAGGQNIFSDLKNSYEEISKESLLKRKPMVIIDPQQISPDSQTKAKLMQDWLLLPTVPAVINQRVYFPKAYPLLIPGTRIGKNAMDFARMIHPEAFDD